MQLKIILLLLLAGQTLRAEHQFLTVQATAKVFFEFVLHFDFLFKLCRL